MGEVTASKWMLPKPLKRARWILDCHESSTRIHEISQGLYMTCSIHFRISIKFTGQLRCLPLESTLWLRPKPDHAIWSRPTTDGRAGGQQNKSHIWAIFMLEPYLHTSSKIVQKYVLYMPAIPLNRRQVMQIPYPMPAALSDSSFEPVVWCKSPRPLNAKQFHFPLSHAIGWCIRILQVYPWVTFHI
jgi:hypothetical protein